MELDVPQIDIQQASLNQNEKKEAMAFDRAADQLDKTQLRTSDWTFLRYRSATLGKPLFNAYPDLVFKCLGKLCCVDSSKQSPKPLNGIRILDLGSGDGSWSVILAEQGANVTSIEISPKQVELAYQRMQIHNLTWHANVGSAYELKSKFDEGSFDLVFGQGILHHLTLDLERVYAEVQYLVKPGGCAVFTEPYSGSRSLRWLRERLAWMVPLDKESPDERPLIPSDLQTLRQFFNSVEIVYSDLFEKFARRIFRSKKMEIVMVAMDHVLLQIKPLRHFAGIVFIVVRN